MCCHNCLQHVTEFAAKPSSKAGASSTKGNADRSVQGTCLDSNLSGLLLGSTHNVALFTVEGWHGL